MPAGLPGNLASLAQQAVSALELPGYWTCCCKASRDVGTAFASLIHVGYLTLRPFLLLAMLLSKSVWRFVAIHLDDFFELFRTILIQVKTAVVWLIYKQASLSRAAVGVELILVGVLAGCYFTRRYIQKKKYVERTTRWYRRRKQKVAMAYNRLVRRISKTSLWLAMLIPHVLFAALAGSVKMVFPRLITWLACDTPATALLSLWYPFVWTVSLLHQWRNFRSLPEEPTSTGTRTGLYPRTTPRSPERRTEWLRSAVTPARRRRQQERRNEVNLIEESQHWLKYWVVYSLFYAACRVCVLIPLVGRVLERVSLASLLQEFRLVLFVWIFVLPMLLVGDADTEYENRPLELLYQQMAPVAVSLYQYTSNAIPASLWQKVVSKVQSLFDLLVLIKFVSTETKDKLVHIVQESAPLLPPAITLFMPGFITEFGVLYVKSIVPSAKSSALEDSTKTVSLLEYWVLNCVLSGLLQWFSSVLWWIPFSTHVVFVLYSYLQIPKTTASFYNVWEEELMAFGLLARPCNEVFELRVEKTVSARVLRALYNSLPSAADDDNEGEAGNEEEEMEPNSIVAQENNSDRVDSTEESFANNNETARVAREQDDTSSSDGSSRQLRRRPRGHGSSSSSSDDDSSKLRRSSRRRRKPLQQLY